MKLGALLLAAGCSLRAAGSVPPPTEPARPAGCQPVTAGADLQAAIDGTPDGGALCLAPGVYRGPLRLARAVTVWGPTEAVVRSTGEGTTLRVEGAGRLSGFTVDGSGGRFDLLDGAVHVGGAGAVVEGLTVVNAVYGILVERARGVAIRGNRVRGDARETFGLRGDPIRLWETTDSMVEGNDVEDGRDVVVWYSSRNRVEGNVVRGGRYGTHLMYSHDNVVAGNRYENDVVGVFVMYSRNVTLRDNVVVGAMAAAGMGIGLKDAGNVRVERNRLIQDRIGLYIDNSPTQISDRDWIEDNVIRLCDAAVVFHGGAEGNELRRNDFADNSTQVKVEGGGDAQAAAWAGNYFDDYAGYDLDGDQVGDLPYELRSISGELLARYPDAAFLRGTPALALADAAGRLVPLLQPTVILTDRRPRMEPRHAR